MTPLLRLVDVARSPKLWVERWAANAYQLRHIEGWSVGRIAGTFGVSCRTVQRWCDGIDSGKYPWPRGVPFYISQAPGRKPVYCYNCGVQVR